MARYTSAWLLVCVAGWTTGGPASAAIELSCEHTSTQFVLPPSPEVSTLQIHASTTQPALVELLEAGQDISVQAPPALQLLEVQVPPRLGRTGMRIDAPLQLKISRLREGHAEGRVAVHLHCDPAQLDKRLRWLQTAHDWATRLTGGPGSLKDSDLAATRSALQAAAWDADTQALSEHLLAQGLLLSGHAADSAEAFLAVADRWSTLGDGPRAAAARVAAIEDLNRSGGSARVLELVQPRASSNTPHYYELRLEKARCLALTQQSQAASASECYAPVMQGLQTLGELSEFGATALDYASLERSLGKLDSARAIAAEALALASGPQADLIRGRVYLLFAELDSAEGDVVATLRHLHAAQLAFSLAKEPRWQTAVLRRLANTLVSLRALGDARIAVQQSLQVVDERDAPALHAFSKALLARIDLEDGRWEDAHRNSSEALAQLRALKLEREAELVTVDHLRMQVAAGALEAATLAWHSISPRDDEAKARWNLVGAELALATWTEQTSADQLPVLNARLAAIAADKLGFAEHIRLARVQAWSDWHAGDRQKAHTRLLSLGRTIHRAADDTQAPLLAQALRASARQLRQTAVELLVRDRALNSDEALLQAVSPWVLLDTPALAPRERGTSTDDGEDFDRMVGRLLLDAKSLQSESSASPLLGLLAPAPQPPAESRDSDHARALPASLTKGQTLLWVSGERQALVFEWKDGRPRAHAIEGLQHVREATARLDALSSRADSSVQQIAIAAGELSRRVLGWAEAQPLPTRLQVLGDEAAQAIPWPLLYWPADPQPLGLQIPISLLQLQRHGPQTALARPARIEVLQSARIELTKGVVLPTLVSAQNEAHALSVEAAEFEVSTVPAAGREALLNALSIPGNWVHVSAHGHAAPALLAGSGLWAQGKEYGEFVTATEILHQGTQAGLVVLNACELAADTAQPAIASTDFARSLSEAGAQHVIAARHAVSDSAGNLWVPAFYRHLLSSAEHDPASALLAARKRLAASRAYRHPFHWGAWVHIQSTGSLWPESFTPAVQRLSHED